MTGQLFFNWVSLHASLNSHYEAWSYKKKEKKDGNHRGVLFRKNPKKKGNINPRLKAIEIMGQRKAFCKERIRES